MVSLKITQMLEERKRVPNLVGKSTHLYKDLGFDSLSFVLFLLQVEEVFHVTIDIMEMETCLQVDQLIKLIENKIKEQIVNT